MDYDPGVSVSLPFTLGPRSKHEFPYSYDPILVFNCGLPANATVYTDRLYSWDHKLHDELCKKHFGDSGQYWADRKPADIQEFLRERFNAPELVLCTITEYCNQSSGYPVWRLDYSKHES